MNSKRLFSGLLCLSISLTALFGSSCIGLSALNWSFWVIVGVFNALFALRLLRYLGGWLSRQDLFAPWIAFPCAYVIWFGVGSIDVLRVPSSISFGAFDPIPYEVLLYAGIGLAAYLCGVYLSARTGGTLPPSVAHAFRLGWDRGKYWLAVLALALVMLGTYAYITAHIGIPILSPDPAQARLLIDSYHWYGTPFLASAYTIVFMLLGKIWVSRRSNGIGALGAAGAVLFISALLVSLGSRSAFFVPALVSLVIVHYLRGPLRVRRLAAVVLILFAFLSAYGYYRDQTAGDNSRWLENAGVPLSVQPLVYCYLYMRYTTATFRDVTDVIPRQMPYRYGAITAMPFQTILPGHHQMSDWFFKNLLGNDFIGEGQPAGILGPFYADFGVLGVCAGMFLWGVLLTRLYRWMLTRRTLLAVIIFAWATESGLLGLFGGLFPYLDTLLLPLCWVALNCAIRPRIDGVVNARGPAANSLSGVELC